MSSTPFTGSSGEFPGSMDAETAFKFLADRSISDAVRAPLPLASDNAPGRTA